MPPHPAPTVCRQMQAGEPLGCILSFRMVSVVNFLPFASLCFTLRFLSSPWPHLWRSFLLCGKFSFTTLSPGRIPRPEILCLPFCLYPCPTSFRGDWFASLDIWGPLLAFRSCSMGIVPHGEDLLMYLWWKRWSLCSILLPSWSLPCHFILNTAMCGLPWWLRW